MTRLSPSAFDYLLTEDNATARSLGRLLATGIFERFEAWLDAENINNTDRAIAALEATVTFGVYLIHGMAVENFGPKAASDVKELVADKMEIAFNSKEKP